MHAAIKAQRQRLEALCVGSFLISIAACLPEVQILPSVERPFVFMHLAKAGGQSLRRYVTEGASRSGIPAKEVFVPCNNGLDCLTFHINRTFGDFSVIAGHFGVTELEEAGISNYDCLFNIREPIARAISCLFYFYNELFQDLEHWSEDVFRRKATEEAVGAAVCHNDAARMLVSGMDESVFLEANKSIGTSSVLITKALSSLRRCVIVDLFPASSHDVHWHTKAIPIIKAYFPWLHKGQSIPWENVSNTKLHRRPRRLPYRLIKELEKLNWVDMVIYQHALQLMEHQRAALGKRLTNIS